MQYVSHGELLQRLKDILANYLELTAELKIGFPLSEESKHWMVLITYVLEEIQLRFGSYPAGYPDGFMADAQIPRPGAARAGQAIEAVRQQAVALGTYLVKYGRSQYLRPAFEQGLIRISPATFYNDPSLNPAIRDDELALSIQGKSDDVKIEVLDKHARESLRTIQPIGNITVTTQAQTNYYVYCLSAVLAPRLFLDFDADACLLITEWRSFVERLLRGVAEQLPNWNGFATVVRYIDPLRSMVAELDPIFGKHFRYTYQREYRVACLPPEPVTELSSLTMQLGSLADCCDLICL
jgi:hypothetical protein